MATPNEDSPSPHTFTFLNYDTPKHSAIHRRAVKSHISSKYRTARRQQAEPRYALPQRLALQPPPVETPDTTSLSLKTNRRSPRTPLIERRRVQQQSISSPLTINFHGLRADPFHSLPGQQTPCVTSALDYYVQVLSPLHEPLLLAVNMVNPMMTWAFPLIISHESAYHAAVALSQAYLEKRGSPTSPPSQEVDFHRRKAVTILRERLHELDGGVPDDGALLTVLALASLDVLYQEDTIMNRKGLALLVAMKGGLDQLGMRGLIKAYLVQFDYFWMLETGAKSVFPLSKRKQLRLYPQHPFNEDALSLIKTLPPGFSAVAQQGSLGMDVVQILSRVSKFVESKISSPRSRNEKSPSPDGHDYPDIFDVCFCLHSSSATEHSLEKNVCLALILFSFNVHDPDPKTSKITAYRGSRQELTRSLPFTQQHNVQEQACLLWIWIVLLASWKLEFNLQENDFPLSQAFFDKFPEAKRWKTVETIMRRFLWYEPLAQVWKASWQEALYVSQGMKMTELPILTAGAADNGRGPGSPMRSPYGRSNNKMSRDSTPTSTSTTGSNLHEDDGGRQQMTVALPPMMTLDTYLGQIR